MSEKHHIIPVWFFVGVLLLVYGFLIFVKRAGGMVASSNTVLAELHAPVWWGGLLFVLGLVYCIKFRARSEVMTISAVAWRNRSEAIELEWQRFTGAWP